MVGNICSADPENGYGYILIKSYDCDDMAFVNPETSFQLYRVNRDDISAELLYTNNQNTSRHLSHRNITDIVNGFKRMEYKADYPLDASWSVNSSGIVEFKSFEDYALQWPLKPYNIEMDSGYIHITDFFITGESSYLKSSFVSETINEAAYYCGAYIGDIVIAIGDEIYCTFDGAYLVKHLFKSNMLCEIAQKFSDKPKNNFKNISRKKLLDKIKNLNIKSDYTCDFDSRGLCGIKKECIVSLTGDFEKCLKNNLDIESLIYKMRITFDNAFEKLQCQKENFMFYSGGRPGADINYLTFNDLMMTYSIGEFKNELSEKIKTNRERKRAFKYMEVPRVIYKRKLYFDYKKEV